MNPDNTQPTTPTQGSGNVASIIANFKAANPTAVSQSQQSNPNDWYSQVKAGAYTPAQPTTQPAQPNPVTQPIVDAGKGLVSDTNAHAANIVQDLSSKPSFSGALDVAGNVAGEVGSIFGRTLQAVTPQPIKDALSQTAQSIAGTPAAKAVIDAWNKFQAQNPEQAKNIGNAVNIAALFGGDVALDGAPTAGELAQGAKEGVSNLATAGKDAMGSAVDTAKGVITKTPEQIASGKDAFVKDLVTPQMTSKDLTGAIKTGKVTEGAGITGARDVTGAVPNFDKITSAVNEVPGVSEKNTLLENANAIHDHIGTVAQDLKTQLGNSTFKGFSPTQFDGYMNKVRQSLAENPMITGDAQQSADKILNKFNSLVEDKGYTPNGLLDARKSLDTWMSAQKGSSVFDPARESAISTALRAIRQGGNDFLSKLAPDVPVKDMLAKQSSLYDAIENIAPKAAKEGSTGLQQFVKAHPNIVKAAKFVATGAGAGVGYEGLKAAGVPLP